MKAKNKEQFIEAWSAHAVELMKLELQTDNQHTKEKLLSIRLDLYCVLSDIADELEEGGHF